MSTQTPARTATAPRDHGACTGPSAIVIDCDRDRRGAIRGALEAAGFGARGATSPAQAAEMSAEAPTDLLVVDALRPDVDALGRRRGFWHAGAEPRVLFVGGPRDSRLSIRLLGIGDDHLAAPYAAEEMVARAQAILRRRTPHEASRILAAGHWTLDLRHCVLVGPEALVSLTRTEVAVLAALMERPGVAVSKREIMHAAWGHDFGRGGGIVETYVSYLRRKLADAGPRIRTIRGAGYLLDPGPSPGPRRVVLPPAA